MAGAKLIEGDEAYHGGSAGLRDMPERANPWRNQ